MSRTTELEAALKRRFFPYVESMGFIRDTHQKPRIISFRRKTGSVVQVFALLWDRRGRPRFKVQFNEAPLTGVNHRGDHISADDVLPGNVVVPHGWLAPDHGLGWFRMDRSLWRRFVSMQQDNAPDRLVDLVLGMFPEIIGWWESKTIGPHLRVFPAISLPPRHKFSGVMPVKSASRTSRIHYLVAHSLKLATWGSALLSSVFLERVACQS